MDRLAGKVAIITGAARGMGAAHVRRFVEEGAAVLLTDVREAEGQALAVELGQNVMFLKHDVAEPSDWAVVVEKCIERFGKIDILVNNAGILGPGSIQETTLEMYMKVFRTNELGVFLGMKAVLPHMEELGGSIVNISSSSGLVGVPNTIAYTASKFAVRGMTKVAAIEYAHRNIRVNSVHPGIIETPLLDGAQPGTTAEISRLTPLQRMALPEEVSHMVLFLASNESSFCTGAEFVVDGGQTSG